MSYNSPPVRSKYGDTDFSDDTWTPPNDSYVSSYDSPSTPPTAQPPLAPPNSNQLYNTNMMTGQPPSPPVTPVALANSLTPEDLLFLRSWQQDSYFRRVLPLTAISFGSLFYFNKLKSRPNKAFHYVLIGSACYFIGKASYRGELKRRLAVNNSNTPFILGLKRMVGLIPGEVGAYNEVGQSNVAATYGAAYGRTQPNWNASGQELMNANYTRDIQQTPFESMGRDIGNQTPVGGAFGEPTATTGPTSSSTTQGTSYDELRARNRGLIR